MIDDLGADVPVSGRVRRVVSLVPSITEAIAATCPHTLVGCTDYCIRPAHLDEVVGHEMARIRGTKNPDRAAITDLEPDLSSPIRRRTASTTSPCCGTPVCRCG